jgi:hypothetical protein
MEGISYKLFRLPRWGVEKHIYGVKPNGNKTTDIFKPYSEYSNFENGYRVNKRNNAGLPGLSVDTDTSNKFIFLLGDSFVHASQVESAEIASSVLQEKLKSLKYSVLNLAFGDSDPYLMYFQSIYYSQTYSPKHIILILPQPFKWALDTRYGELSFSLPENFGTSSRDGLLSRAEILMCNNSSFIQSLNLLLKRKLKESQVFNVSMPEESNNTGNSKLSEIISAFGNKYGNKFILVSIFKDDNFNNYLEKYCKENKINFHQKNINIPENKINGIGHLTENGNKILGMFLYDIIKETSYD